MRKIVAGLTTIPCRLNIIDQCLQSILSDKGFSEVILNIPYVSRKGIPYPEADIEKLRMRINNPRLVINRVSEDHGPITKVTGCLDYVKDPETVIVIFDDDREVVGPVSKKMLEKVTENPGRVYSFGGWIRGSGIGKYQFVNYNSEDSLIDVVMGVTCIGFRRGIIDKRELLDFEKSDPRFTRLDDIRISGYLARKNVDRISIGGSPRLYLRDIEYPGTEKLSGTVKFWQDNISCMDKLSDMGLFKVNSISGLPMILYAVLLLSSIGLIVYWLLNRGQRTPFGIGGLVSLVVLGVLINNERL